MLGELPCKSRAAAVTCSCSSPGKGGKYVCSDPNFSGKCSWGGVCLPPVGHVFSAEENPCGPKVAANILKRFKAYSSVSKENPCSRTLLEATRAEADLCTRHEDQQLIIPDCAGRKRVVPKILHSIGRTSDHFLLSMIAAANPTYSLNRQSDHTAITYIERACGLDARRAYECLAPSAFRADLFRFCALFSDGGVYMDEDIVPLHSIDEIISVCSSATLGHDYPAGGEPAKQMKILASAPKAPIMLCALNSIIQNVKIRAKPSSPLGLTGPLMLQQCFQKHSSDVAITYIDTRGAVWPFTGMRAENKILAYEYPDSPKHFCSGETCSRLDDYAKLFKSDMVYTAGCELFHAQ